MSLSSPAEVFRWSLSLPHNRLILTALGSLGHLNTGAVLQRRAFRLLYAVASYELRKVDGTLTRPVGRRLLLTEALRVRSRGSTCWIYGEQSVTGTGISSRASVLLINCWKLEQRGGKVTRLQRNCGSIPKPPQQPRNPPILPHHGC